MKYLWVSSLVAGFLLLSGFDQGERPQKEWIIYPKGDPYTNEWKKVEEADKADLPKTALEIVRKIYGKAREAKNYSQQIKALLHILKYTLITEEDGYTEAIRFLSAELSSAVYPLKPIYQSVLAQYLAAYLQENIYSRVNSTEDKEPNDIRTWSADQISETIRSLYFSSLEPADSLFRTPVWLFEAVLDTAPGSKIYRPTLFDLLAFRALNYFSQIHEKKLPQEEFFLTDTRALFPADEFMRFIFPTPDSTSNLYHSLQIYQRLLRGHWNDPDPTALVDIDLLRLKWAYENVLDENKAEAYLRMLETMERRYSRDTIVTQILYTMAEYFYQTNLPDTLSDGTTPWQKAYAICEKAVTLYPYSRGGRNCAALMSRITEKSLQIHTEKTVPPNQNFRLLVEYRNVSSVHFRLIRRKFPSVGQIQDDRLANLLKMKPMEQWSQPLSSEKDYRSHRTEIRVKGLPTGYYTLIASADPSFRETGNGLAMIHFFVTAISLVKSVAESSPDWYYVCNSTTGQPLRDVKVQIYEQIYNYQSYQYEWKSKETRVTGEDGRFSIKTNNQWIYLAFVFSYQDDQYIEFHYVGEHEDRPEKSQIVTKIFTDRSIYRPGQTIWFKGIVYQTGPRNRQPNILPFYKTRVIFYDPQSQKVDSKEFVTNAFGSFSGSFTAPASGLTGLMTIRNESGYVSVSVEEYKRPKFEVRFEPTGKSYRVNETIRLSAIAQSYTGAVTDGAKVRYRVVREGYFPYWRDDRIPVPAVQEKTIAYGVTVTDKNGRFVIEFPAKPDPKINPKWNPEFNFTVIADVTDAAGETRSAKTTIRVGYVALAVSITIPEWVSPGDSLPAVLYTANLNGDKEPAQGKLTLIRLRQPASPLRERLWQNPDRWVMNEEDFRRYFPLDIYRDEDNPDQWAEEETVAEMEVDTRIRDRYLIPIPKDFVQGFYRLRFETRDRYGMDLKSEKYVSVLSPQSRIAPLMMPVYFYASGTTVSVGDTVRMLVGSAFPDIQAQFILEQDGRILKKENLTLNREQRWIAIPVEEHHRGGFSCHVYFLKYQRTYHREQFISVPWDNKKLQIEMATFRDRLQPGEKERWQIIIRNPVADSIGAEMVATLYDASLDAFRPHRWQWAIMPWHLRGLLNWYTETFSTVSASAQGKLWNLYRSGVIQNYDEINFFGAPLYFSFTGMKFTETVDGRGVRPAPHLKAKGLSAENEDKMAVPSNGKKKKNGKVHEEVNIQESQPIEEMAGIVVRKNLQETAFFYPHMKTNAQGELIIEFTIPQALTQWRLMGMAHTTELQTGILEKTLVTQKELMVQPNLPRFLREGDEFWFAAKITNLTTSAQSVQVRLSLWNAVSMQPADRLCGLKQPDQNITIAAGASAPVFWKIRVPAGVTALTSRVVAKSGLFSDGEENTLIILPNKILVTETLPLPVRGKGAFGFTMKKLNDSRNSSSLIHERLTLEFTANPAWYAIQALPYMMEFPHECSEQIFSRMYANAIGSHIAQSDPRIEKVFQAWRNTPALESNLLKNEELKSVLIQETPWLAQGIQESEQKKNIGRLLDPLLMKRQLAEAVNKLQDQQLPNGAWPWFTGMTEDRYITQYIVAGCGHLKTMGIAPGQYGLSESALRKAVGYMDNRMNEDYQYLLKNNLDLKQSHIGYIQMHYLYARSFYPAYPVSATHRPALEFWKQQAKEYWTNWNMTGRAMIALALFRMQDMITPLAILRSIREHAQYSQELGMYWKTAQSFLWHDAPVEQQALLIEAFDEIAKDSLAVEEMKVWLLKQKQTRNWKTTKATAGACYALLRRGSNWLAEEPLVEIQLGQKRIRAKSDAEAGTGYFKTAWLARDVEPAMGKITVRKDKDGVAWGAMYWQYYEDMEKITVQQTPLRISKKIFIRQNTAKGTSLVPVTGSQKIRIGDEVVVRLELQTDRAMEYVHVKDLRAAGLEPVSVLSGYRWQGNIGYYESIKDASANFFISYLPKGAYTIEYSLHANLKGTFSNGIATVQCMYAPEFSAHTAGQLLTIEP